MRGQRGICPSGKRRYRTEAEANEEMGRLNENPDYPMARQITRSYKCRQCGGYHHTSKGRA